MARAQLTFASLLVALMAVVATGCGNDSERVEPAAAKPNPHPAKAPKPVKPDHDGIPLETPHNAYPLVWVRVHEHVRLLSQPGGGELVDKDGRKNQWGSISAFGVVREAGKFAAVTTPVLPNGHVAWVRLNPDNLRGGWTKTSVVVDLSDRRAALVQAGDPKRAFAVTVGAAGSETPTGRFSVTDTFSGGLNPAYGCCALALSATQPHLPSGWLGGQRIAIHGTYGPLGIAASHGCVRAADADVAELVEHVPLGAPVFIRE
jgi:hypothetical protein